MKYDYVIAGSGLSGAVYARIMAERGKSVLVLEKRSHIAGNLYDEKSSEGILIQKYGPHAFHTSSEDVHKFVHKYAKWLPYKLVCEVSMCGQCTPSPFNFKTIDQYYSEEEAKELKDSLLKTYPGRETVTIVELLESNDEHVKRYAQFLFDNDYSLYTAKQWGIKPSEIDVSVLRRVPIRMDYQSKYFTDKYQYMPDGGFTAFVNSLLSHKNIEIHLNEDVCDFINMTKSNIEFKKLDVSEHCNLVYTGALDELFDYKYGELPYRSLRFKYKTYNVDSFQNECVVAYPHEPEYTRITEFKKIPIQNIHNVTTVAYEYPLTYSAQSGSEPYYPIPTDENSKLYSLYREEADKIKNLILCGRLAEYKYYNMDQAIYSILTKL